MRLKDIRTTEGKYLVLIKNGGLKTIRLEQEGYEGENYNEFRFNCADDAIRVYLSILGEFDMHDYFGFSGRTIRNMSKSYFDNVTISNAPLSVLESCIAKMKLIDGCSSAIVSKINYINEYKKSLINKAVSGD